MAITVAGMKKARNAAPKEIVPDAPENITLSKAQFIEKENKRKEVAKRIERYRQELMTGRPVTPEEQELTVMKQQLEVLATEAATAEAMAASPEEEKKAEDLKAQVVDLRTKIKNLEKGKKPKKKE